MTDTKSVEDLQDLAARLISALVTQEDLKLREGTVMSLHAPPYRRVDRGGRALAFVRTRPRRQAVRVDVSGLWVTPRACAIAIPSTAGAATLMIRNEEQLAIAIAYLRDVVLHTVACVRKSKGIPTLAVA